MFEIAHNRVADVGTVDWKEAAKIWPTWQCNTCDAEYLVQQAAERLGLIHITFAGFLWQEGTTVDGPMAPCDFNLCTVTPERPVVVALEVLEGAQPRLEPSGQIGLWGVLVQSLVQQDAATSLDTVSDDYCVNIICSGDDDDGCLSTCESDLESLSTAKTVHISEVGNEEWTTIKKAAGEVDA